MKDTQMLFPVVVSIHEMGRIFFIAIFKFFPCINITFIILKLFKEKNKKN